jgi:uncharacterized protein YutE (UPF0331/DUF86 family)/predicted nucleotidyltransferase
MVDDAAIVDTLGAELSGELAAIYRFGSTATSQSGPAGDIDVAVLLERPLDPVRRFEIQERLAARLNCDVDLIDLRGCSTVFQMQVVSTGMVLTSFDDRARSDFEDLVYGSYVRLNEERREISTRSSATDVSTMDDVVFNKAAIVERCLARVLEEYGGDVRNLREDLRRQDSVVLNLQRACEASIDLAVHVVRIRKLGIPQETRDAFVLLRDANVIEQHLAERMMAMVGFRNIAVHDYRRLDLAVVQSIVERHLDDFRKFTRTMIGTTRD